MLAPFHVVKSALVTVIGQLDPRATPLRLAARFVGPATQEKLAV